jgi:hypothetical protein
MYAWYKWALCQTRVGMKDGGAIHAQTGGGRGTLRYFAITLSLSFAQIKFGD